jgi:hypothetical protein
MVRALLAFRIPPYMEHSSGLPSAKRIYRAGRFAVAGRMPGRRVSHLLETWEAKMFTILMVILILMLVGALPAWPYSRSWGYYPSGGLGLVVVILIVLILMR